MVAEIPLHTGFSKDLRSGRVLDGVWHRWMVVAGGIERICDGQGEADGLGVAGNFYMPDGTICDECQSMIFGDILREKDARFAEIRW